MIVTKLQIISVLMALTRTLLRMTTKPDSSEKGVFKNGKFVGQQLRFPRENAVYDLKQFIAFLLLLGVALINIVALNT